MNIDLLLANLGDDDSIPAGPSGTCFVELDQHFAAIDYGLEEAADDIAMELPRGKIAKVSRQRMRACKTDAELRNLDRELYRSANLNPADYGI